MTGRPTETSDYTGGFRLYVKVDMEGVSGVVSPEQLHPGSPEYADARGLLMHDLGAVLDGAFSGGCTEAVIYDAHGEGRNVDPGLLDRRAVVISGRPPPSADFLCGLDASFGAMFLVGSHARAGMADALLPHICDGIEAISINGTAVGEIGLEAALAGTFGVPLALVSGDSGCVAEARALLGDDLETVEVKRAISTTSAVCLSTARTGLLLREAAARAVHGALALAPVVFHAPARFEVTFSTAQAADAMERRPSVERTGPSSVCTSGPDVVAAYRDFVLARQACRATEDETSSDFIDRRLIDGIVGGREQHEPD